MTSWVTTGTWDDAPHLSKEMKDEYLQKIPPHLREVRTKGMPTFGAGLVWPIDEPTVRIPRFSIPDEFYQSYALDTGWNWNGVVWFAEDRNTGIVYVTNVYKRGQIEPAIVAEAIKSRGAWMAGCADAADVNRMDGKQYIEIYKRLGLDIELPNKAIETGVTMVWQLFSTGKLRIFEDCVQLFDELRVYMRNGSGEIQTKTTGKIKEGQDDHLCDALRHGVMSALIRGKRPPTFVDKMVFNWDARPGGGGQYGYMG